MNPEESHPQLQAGVTAAFLASWHIPEPWSFSLEDAQENAFFSHGYWGTSLLTCVLKWLHELRWASEAGAVAQATIGVSWMELVLSFMIFSQSYIPVRRRNAKGESSFAWAHSSAEAKAFSYTWNECATQFAHIVQQTISLSGCSPIPDYVHSARVCSLYRQGAGTCVFGWSHRPSFPVQAEVCRIIESTFRKRARPLSYSWWPELECTCTASDCLYEWTAPRGSFNVLQKKLKLGNRLAKSVRANG